MSTTKRDYVDVIYNENDRPLTTYPGQLAKHLFQLFKMQAGDKFLDIGCGRGEFLKGFIQCGVDGYGVDQSDAATKYCPEATLKTSDIENEGIPYDDGYFDVVYSKSVIEHFYYPERLMSEIYRILKPGGLVITLCPDWEYNYRIYFEDYTHRTPFMSTSLADIHTIHGFENIKVKKFRQLPILWSGFGKYLTPFAELTRVVAPTYIKKYSKWTRFSKEIMLISSANKPAS